MTQENAHFVFSWSHQQKRFTFESNYSVLKSLLLQRSQRNILKAVIFATLQSGFARNEDYYLLFAR